MTSPAVTQVTERIAASIAAARQVHDAAAKAAQQAAESKAQTAAAAPKGR